MKKCFKCSQEKPLSEFYRHPRMGDGHLGKCKECTKKYVAERCNSESGRKKVALYEAKRFQDPERKKKLYTYQVRSREKNPEKWKARYHLGNAVRDGRVNRLPCEVCGAEKSEAHHDDYSKPFEVRWLCFKHHREIGHNQIVN